MNRAILNLEVTSFTRCDDVVFVQLLLNHHVIAEWQVPDDMIIRGRGHLEQFVAAKMFEFFHGGAK